MRLPLDVRMTVSDAFVMLGRDYPAIRQRVLDDQSDIRRHVNVFVNGENVRFMQGSPDAGFRRLRSVDLSRAVGRMICRFKDRSNDYIAESRKIS